MSKKLDEAWVTIYHYNDEIIHDMGSEYVENPLKEELDIVNTTLKLFDKIVEYFMTVEYFVKQGNAIACLFRNSLLGNTYQEYCKNCKDEFKFINPIDKETYDNLSKYFKAKDKAYVDNTTPLNEEDEEEFIKRWLNE